MALLVDTSFSMAMDGRWVPMKRTALALHTLIRSRFRGDDLQLIGFGRHAEVMEIEQLTALDAMWDKGTNLHHALLLANRHFRKHPNAQPVLLIVTDGEPTSHLEPDGEVYFSYPPHPLTVAYAVRELDNAGRLGAQTTFFRLGEDPGLARFIDSMAQRVDGRVVAPELDDLGAAVVGSYLGSRGAGRPAVRLAAAATATGSAAAGSGSATDRESPLRLTRSAASRAVLADDERPPRPPLRTAQSNRLVASATPSLSRRAQWRSVGRRTPRVGHRRRGSRWIGHRRDEQRGYAPDAGSDARSPSPIFQLIERWLVGDCSRPWSTSVALRRLDPARTKRAHS